MNSRGLRLVDRFAATGEAAVIDAALAAVAVGRAQRRLRELAERRRYHRVLLVLIACTLPVTIAGGDTLMIFAQGAALVAALGLEWVQGRVVRARVRNAAKLGRELAEQQLKLDA